MERNPYFDNAKFILIFLVVFGHILQPYTGDQAYVRTTYLWIYTFHMPVFIFIAGYFAKGIMEKSYILRLFKKLIIPYLIFQLLYTAYYFFIGKEGWLTDNIFYPQWSLWFLMSLFCWHLVLIFYKKIPPKYGVPLSFFLGIIAGYINKIGPMFSLSRTITFFPYFILGNSLSEHHIFMLKRRSVKIVALVYMLFVFMGIHLLPDISVGWFLQSKSYSNLGVGLIGGLYRSIVYMLGLTMGAAVLAWIPKEKFSFTSIGARTLTVYLLHGFFIHLFRKYDLFSVERLFDFILLMLISYGIVRLLSIKDLSRFA